MPETPKKASPSQVKTAIGNKRWKYHGILRGMKLLIYFFKGTVVAALCGFPAFIAYLMMVIL